MSKNQSDCENLVKNCLMLICMQNMIHLNFQIGSWIFFNDFAYASMEESPSGGVSGEGVRQNSGSLTSIIINVRKEKPEKYTRITLAAPF